MSSQGQRFRRRALRRGYKVDEVDAFLDRVAVMLTVHNLAYHGWTPNAQLAQLYFQLHGLDADADLLRRNVAIFEQSLQLTQDRFNAGVASGADVAQARTQLESTRAQLVDVGVGRAQFEHAIAVLMGETPAMVSIPEKIVNTPPPEIPLGVPSTLMERRPDVAATERAIAAANEQIGIAKAAYFPMLTLSGTQGFVSTSLAQLFTVPSLFWAVGPQLAATLFDGGLRKGQVRFSQAAYDASVATYRQTVLTAFQQVEDQLSSLRILEQEHSIYWRAIALVLDRNSVNGAR